MLNRMSFLLNVYLGCLIFLPSAYAVGDTDLAQSYGIATQAPEDGYFYYSPPEDAIDGDDATYNHTQGTATQNWWQLELPDTASITSIMIQGRNSNTNRLAGAGVYITNIPYIGTLDETTKVATLVGSADKQIFAFSPSKSGKYLIVKATGTNNLHLATVEVFGDLPAAPAFYKSDYTLGVAVNSAVNSVVGEVKATDFQGDSLSYSIVGGVPFSIDNNGMITLTQHIDHNVTQSYGFTVTASDGTNSDTSNVTVKVLNAKGVYLERWNGIGGTAVSDLLNDPHYQDAPDETRTLTALDINENVASDFGQKLSAILKPELSGNYVFAIVGDDGTTLKLSETDDSTIATEIATGPSYSSYQNWGAAGKSVSITLEAGSIYAIEALHKERGGAEHVSVGWKREGDADFTVIPASQLYMGVLDSETVKPAFDQQDTFFMVDHIPSNGELLATLSATDTQGDALTYSLSGAEAANFAIDSDGKITANGAIKVAAYTFDVQVNDGTYTTTKTITLLVSVNIAEQFGVATQSSDVDYSYYQDPANAIDGDLTTYNMTASAGWLQVALPVGSKVAKIVIRNRTDAWSNRLSGTKVYLGKTTFNGTLIESDYVGTLTNSIDPQIITFSNFKEGDFVLLKEDNTNLHVLEVEVYGESPESPVFNPYETFTLIIGTTTQGSTVATVTATDFQYDSITYSIDGSVPFAIDDQGNITVSGTLTAGTYNFNVVVSDGSNTITTPISIQVTSATAVDDALTSGSVTDVTDTELIQATLDEIEASKTFLLDAKTSIFNLNADGTAKPDGTSLTSIDWDPSWDAATMIATLGTNTPLLISNATNNSRTVYEKQLAIIGEKETSRYLVMGSNPLRTPVNDQMNVVMENAFSWLTARNDLKTSTFNVVIAHLDDSYYFRDETGSRTWLDSHYTGQVSYNTENSCDGTALANCLDNTVDLLIISQVSTESDDVNAIAATVNQALQNGIAVLYIHHDGNFKTLGKALFSDVFKVSYEWDNRNKELKLENYDPVNDIQALSADLLNLKTLFTHFKNSDYNFDWSVCKDSSGAMDENNDRCDDVVGLQSEFQDGATAARNSINILDKAQKNIFNEAGYRLYKLLILTADKFRQSVVYPMDKVTTDDNDFMRSYYSDHVIYTYRTVNPAQANMGNFSRSDFSHIAPITKIVNLTSKERFRSTGVYALPGQTVKITRNDNSDLTVKVFINTLRSGATHQYEKYGYKRPKYLQSQYFELKTGETIELTSPYGGTLQLNFNKNDLPVQVTFENIGEHAYWASAADNESFAQKLAANEYDWAEVATAGFEVHSKLDKMIESVEDDRWGRTAEGLANAVEKYTSNYPHVLAGFKGEGVDIVPEIHDWANDRGITIETIDTMKHMNADQATCGYGCSGNPYDAYWSFNPIGHGDIHELGHSLQKKRFEGFPNHAATNTFSYYTKSRYFDITGGENECGGQPFKTLFETIQGSVGQSDVEAYLKTNLWDTAGLGEQYLLKIQAMMHAENRGKVENGWHVLARVHILEREKRRATQDWEVRKASIGFSTYTLDEFNAIRDNDWLIVSYSYAAGLDYRNYFDMMGIPYSQKARDQIASFGYDVVPNELFVSTDGGYCDEDGAGRLFDRPTIAIDGAQTWPADTDTDGDGRWDVYDNCPANASADQLDTDNDGMGDVCDSTPTGDDDNDGVDNATDNCPSLANTDQLDTDNDLEGNVCDSDDDNDGLPDAWEITYGLDPLVNDAAADNDNDGFTNVQEYQNGTDPNIQDAGGNGTGGGTSNNAATIIPIIMMLLLDE